MTANQALAVVRLLVLVALTLLLGAFHGFVGWHKAFSTHEQLVQHAAWTMHLPTGLGKAVGWIELIVTAVLLVALVRPPLARMGMWACIVFILMELAATVSHYLTQDGGSLMRNAVSIALTALLAWLYATRCQPRPPERHKE
jgi:uncharacterized membrane protein YphA (DoxX/SURF4 family)